LVFIVSTAEEFIAACEKALNENQTEKLARVDKFLAQNSWDKTWSQMAGLIDDVVKKGTKVALA
jgi:UDP-galactopyranose mutase